MHLSRNCPFSNKTNLHLELPGAWRGLGESSVSNETKATSVLLVLDSRQPEPSADEQVA